MKFSLNPAPMAWCLSLCLGLVTSVQAQVLKIGVIAPLTGAGAPWGLAAAEAPKIVAAEINAQGGLAVGGKKYRIDVIAYDDQYKAADSVAAYNRLRHQDGVKYMIVHTSPAAVALKQRIEDDKVIALTGAYTVKAFDANTKYMFRIYSTAADYLPGIVQWFKQNHAQRRVYLVNPNDETGWDQDKLAQKTFEDNGFVVAGHDLYERHQKDFQPLFTKVIRTQAEIIDLGSTSPATSGLMIRQAREMGFKGMFLKSGGAAPKEVVAGAGKEAAEGMISMLYVDPHNAGYQRIAAQYQKSRGHAPNEMLVNLYDSVNVLLRAIQKAGDVNDTAKVSAAFAQALPTTSVQGDSLSLGGKATAGADQQIMTATYIAAIRGGEAVVVGKVK